jgi:hypothetical protein
MTNAQSKIQFESNMKESFAIGRNEYGKWYADFGKNYPRTQEYAEETMVGNIQHWTHKVITFVITQTVEIAMNFKIGRYNKYLKAQNQFALDTIIDSFTYNYLKNATININNLFYACNNWNMVFEGIMSSEALKADCFVERSIKKYGSK